MKLAVRPVTVIALSLAVAGWPIGSAIAASAPVPGAAVAPAIAAGWHEHHVPDPTLPSGSLAAVSCLSGVACVAVGSTVSTDGHDVAMAAAWNGTAWSLEPVPDPAGATLTQLSGVSCSSASACLAVGLAYLPATGADVAVAEVWNGTSWVLADPAAGATSSQFSGVWCSPVGGCIAVGRSGPAPLSAWWNGTTWTVESTPGATGATENVLSGVSCSSATACLAVGYDIDGSGVDQPLAEAWNGTSWTIESPSVPAGAGQFGGVSCIATGVCTAVGSSVTAAPADVPLAESWNGTTWAVEPTPVPTGGAGQLSNVSCTASGYCTAVGYAGESALVEGWNDVTWTIEAVPAVAAGVYRSQLAGISCTSGFSCRAVGFSDVPPADLALALAYDGAGWSTMTTVEGSAGTQSSLGAISCTSPSSCTAVGSSGNVALAERWNGTQWSVEATPDPAGATATVLDGVSCTAPDACTAVGYSEQAVLPEMLALVEQWNGSVWTIEPLAAPAGGLDDHLTAVSCGAPGTCTAVGIAGNYSMTATGNGTAWTLQVQTATGLPYDTYTPLDAVSCSTATTCVAVGDYYTGGVFELYAESSDGSGWSPDTGLAVPVGAAQERLLGVSCASVVACTAVGIYDDQEGNEQPLAETWNGLTWALAAATAPAADPENGLQAVSCTAVAACTAVGSSTVHGRQQTLAEVWNGTAWTVSATPSAHDLPGNALLGVSCTALACDAVGVRSELGIVAPLAEAEHG